MVFRQRANRLANLPWAANGPYRWQKPIFSDFSTPAVGTRFPDRRMRKGVTIRHLKAPHAITLFDVTGVWRE
jgi:hypothetical protein